MTDTFVERLQENGKVLAALSDEDVVKLAMSEILMELASGREVPPGTKAKRIALSADLARRAGVKW